MKTLSKEQIDAITFLYSNGQMQEAVDKIKALNQDYPNVPLLFNILGACYKALSQFDGAIQMFENAIKLKPDYAEAYFNLGVMHQEFSRFSNAIESYKKSIEITPKYPDAHNNLGIIYLNTGEIDNSIEHFEWAIAYKPNFAEAYNNLGSAQQELGQLDIALVSYKKAIRLEADYPQAHNNIGITYQKLGQFDIAQTNYEIAINLDQAFASAHFNLSTLKKYKANDKHIIQMKSLLSDNNLSKTSQIFLYFALAKAYEDIGAHSELFKFLDEGNRLRKEELNFSFDHSENNNLTIGNLFNSKSIINKSQHAIAKIRPIFILGMPRSGTSLVEQIISNHHEVFGGGELKNLSKIIIQLIHDSSTFDEIELSDKNLLTIRQQYLDSLSRFNVPELVITDKWPLNFRSIGFILSAIPEAKIIHLKRDSIATCWSIYKNYFGETGNGWAYNLEDIVKFYELYSELMDHWHDLYPNKIYDICYEDLTMNQEEETKKLIEYCELEWDENCLNFHNNKRAVKTASAMQVRMEMYQGSSEKWKKYQEYLQPLIKGLQN